MRYLFLSFTALLFVACSNQAPEDLTKTVDQLIAEDNYSKALQLIDDANPEQTNASLATLKEKTYLNYGLYLEYRGPEESSMRDRMTLALEQYIEVLKLNPKNQKARAEIRQIMDIYSTMPDKSPGDDIIEKLNQLGFNY